MEERADRDICQNHRTASTEVEGRHGEGQVHDTERSSRVWSGRQRFQILKEQGYTHVDVIVEPVFHKMVDAAQKFRKFNKENV